MGFPDSIAAYPDVQELFDKALDSSKGLKLTFSSENEAILNTGRFNAYRVRLRRENERTYPADHPHHKSTPYDCLMIKRRGNQVIVEKLQVGRYNIEDLL
jgi:hypothetical protein